MFKAPHLLLASKSPRRRHLLSEAGFSYDLVDVSVEENFSPQLKAEEVCLYLSQKKAAAFEGTFNNSVLVTADTIVWVNGEVLNKPADKEEARQMLRKLSNNTHEVFTGVTLAKASRQLSFYDRSEVTFYELTDEEIDFYIDHYQPFDKAGSYGVQDWMGYLGVKAINGCFYNVMGFPVAMFYRRLQLFLT